MRKLLVVLGLCAMAGCGTQPASTFPQIGRFVAVQSGGRTWRLDTATGELCLLLAESQTAFEKQPGCLPMYTR
jgi:uncharacterized protein YceK